MVEYWNIGRSFGCFGLNPIIPPFHYSTIPIGLRASPALKAYTWTLNRSARSFMAFSESSLWMAIETRGAGMNEKGNF